MFIIKLGAEALSIKSGSIEKSEGNSGGSNSDLSTNSSTIPDSIFDKDTNLLKNLLNGCLVESALLSHDDANVKRCHSAFFQNNKTEIPNNSHRPRSDTVPHSGMYLSNSKLIENNCSNRKRKLHQTLENNISHKKSILYESLTKESKQNDIISHILSPNSTNTILSNSFINYRSHNPLTSDSLIVENSDSFQNPSTTMKISQPIISTNETKRLRQQINSLLKKIMQIIKYYSNYSSSTEPRRLHFVSELWHKILVLVIVQMDPDNCRFLFRWLLLSVFNDKDEVGCTRRDQILLMEKLQEFVQSYFWLKSNSEIFHCVLFWFMAKYGYPDVFFMSHEVIICKLKNLTNDKMHLESIFKLIQDISELTENHMRHLFCQHLPSDCSMAEFLVQWT